MTTPKVALMTFGDARDHEWKNLFRGLTEPRHKEIIEYCKGQLNPPPYDNQIERLKWDIIYRNPRKWLVEATLKTDKSSISNTVGFKIGTGSSGKKS